MTNKRIPASIEVSPKQAVESADLPNLFPAGTRVYITDVGVDPTPVLVAAAKRVRECGYEPVPHFASRRLTTKAALESRIAATVDQAAVKDVLVIGGGLQQQAGEFSSTMEVLDTGFFDKYGISKIAVAGHPEGSPDFTDEVAAEALRLKQNFAARTDANLRIVTQFGFDAEQFINWAEGVRQSGIGVPIHLGVAGPAKITTLIKYAAMCGVGNSLSFFKKNTRSIATLATKHSPEGVVGPIEDHWASEAPTLVKQMHVFPFGGIKNASQWLVDRGTWDINISLYPSTISKS